MERTEQLLAVILLNSDSLKNATIAEKATQLSRAGFTNVEIANLLSKTSVDIATALYQNRKKAGKKTKKAK